MLIFDNDIGVCRVLCNCFMLRNYSRKFFFETVKIFLDYSILSFFCHTSKETK